jgi:predicted transcriptional regulator
MAKGKITKMRVLTRAEEEVMQQVWKLNECFVRDIIEVMPKPKPAYNTVSTILRILEQKGFIAHRAYGKSHGYFPIITQDEYKSFYLKRFISGYFDGSFPKLVSFFAKDENMDVKELDELLSHLKNDAE